MRKYAYGLIDGPDKARETVAVPCPHCGEALMVKYAWYERRETCDEEPEMLDIDGACACDLTDDELARLETIGAQLALDQAHP